MAEEKVKCSECKGSKQVEDDFNSDGPNRPAFKYCPRCGGSGEEPEYKIVLPESETTPLELKDEIDLMTGKLVTIKYCGESIEGVVKARHRHHLEIVLGNGGGGTTLFPIESLKCSTIQIWKGGT